MVVELKDYLVNVKQAKMNPAVYWGSAMDISGEICIYRIYFWSNHYWWKAWDCILTDILTP